MDHMTAAMIRMIRLINGELQQSDSDAEPTVFLSSVSLLAEAMQSTRARSQNLISVERFWF